MSGHLAPGLVLLAALANGLTLLGIHGFTDHGWSRQLRAWLEHTPYPLPTPHVHWYESMSQARRWIYNLLYLAGCAVVAALFEPVPWLAAGIAWGFVIGAAYLLVRSHRAAMRGENHAH